ncbi:MAG: alpha/beta hydrolase, partial [Cyanobacteria bacterium P01_A01_bin.17]
MAMQFQKFSFLLRVGICLVGFFLSWWIVLPASTAFWLPLSIGAPEVSVWLMGINAISLFLFLFRKRTLLSVVLIGCSTLGLLLSSLPLMQLSTTVRTAEAAMQSLGPDYTSVIPAAQQDQFRTRPFVFFDALRGIPRSKVRQLSNIAFAQPEGVPLSMEIYQPPQPGRYPGIVAIYGGAWRRGDPTANRQFNRYIAAQGYVVWAIDYRHAPQHRFPSQLE